MKRIYLRLIEEKPLDKPEEELLRNVQKVMEHHVSINWLQNPSVHIKGGYIVIGEIPKDVDLNQLLVKLREDGFLAVI